MKLLNQADCGKLIERITSASNTLVADVHLAGVSTLDHIREHGNYTGALQLLNGLNRGLRVKGLAEWYKKFSNSKFSPGLDQKSKQWKADLQKDRTDSDFDIEGAEAITFADFTTEPNYSTLTMEKFIKGLKRTASNTGCFPGTTIPKVSDNARALALTLVQSIEKVTKAA